MRKSSVQHQHLKQPLLLIVSLIDYRWQIADRYLFVGQAELLAQLGLVLCSQVRVPLERPLHAADLLRREGRARPPPWRRRRRRGGGGAVGGEGVTSFTLVAGGLLLGAAAEPDLGRCRRKNQSYRRRSEWRRHIKPLTEVKLLTPLCKNTVRM